jgi:hypothetical protein
MVFLKNYLFDFLQYIKSQVLIPELLIILTDTLL